MDLLCIFERLKIKVKRWCLRKRAFFCRLEAISCLKSKKQHFDLSSFLSSEAAKVKHFLRISCGCDQDFGLVLDLVCSEARDVWLLSEIGLKHSSYASHEEDSMKYQAEHLRFEIAYGGRYITISRDVRFDYDSQASQALFQDGLRRSDQQLQVRSQSILEFEKPDPEIEALIRLLCASSAIKYPVSIDILMGEMVFESLEIGEKVRITGEFRIFQNFIR